MKRILVADDDPEWAETVALRLRADGNTVYTAANGLDAYALYSEKQPDIVVLDVAMPGVDGLTLAKRMHLLNPRTPVLLMSGLTGIADIEAGYSAGAENYFEKPFDIRKLMARIRSIDVQNVYRFGNCTFDPLTRKLTVGANETHILGKTPAGILLMLCSSMGEPVKRKAMGVALLGYDPEDTRTIDTHISKLRGLLKNAPSVAIIACYGEGYQLVSN